MNQIHVLYTHIKRLYMKTRELVYTLTHITHCTTQVEDRRDHVVKGSKLKNETHIIMCQLEIEVSNKG